MSNTSLDFRLKNNILLLFWWKDLFLEESKAVRLDGMVYLKQWLLRFLTILVELDNLEKMPKAHLGNHWNEYSGT